MEKALRMLRALADRDEVIEIAPEFLVKLRSASLATDGARTALYFPQGSLRLVSAPSLALFSLCSSRGRAYCIWMYM